MTTTDGLTSPRPATAGASRRRGRPGAPAVAFVALMVVLVPIAVTTDRFLTLDNARAILASTALVGIAAIGATLVMIAGSAVSLAASQTATVVAMVFLATLDRGLVVATLLAVLCGVVVTAVQGFAVGYWEANPIVLTIAAGFAIGGGSVWFSGGTPVNAASGDYDVLNATPLGLPLAVYVLLLLAVLAEAVLRRTTAGRRMYLVGENRAAARAAGLPVGRVTVVAWTFSGLCLAISGVFLAAFNTSATTNLGGTLTLDAIAAVLVGGTAIAGGKGSALRTLGGALLISVIADVLLLRGYSTGAQILVKGVLVLAVVVLVHLRGPRGSR
ncbi:ribose ABC transporter permease [Actinoplanes sp. NBRC 14428]|uniref:Simple sugar transport system permease protein/ribose transport system permease protein n=1 Tax=Pseudosporangium ferrugineum TaxID=439699 RepID=A0A2T0SB50_9ACTN|nr:ABC transporter permease [Pseudosporangium ferrugineum]PRY30655.1 simple sugar transport system permease protein/ribose transport system permease protein [Pseudosporangium ferrugineum]BCJ50200.1 ribose ABC transporter permease [Actinoplanes sp. NBRC 14428]